MHSASAEILSGLIRASSPASARTDTTMPHFLFVLEPRRRATREWDDLRRRAAPSTRRFVAMVGITDCGDCRDARMVGALQRDPPPMTSVARCRFAA